MKNFLNVIWVTLLLCLGVALLAKVVSVCDPRCSFWQDPMEEWIAIGISALLIQAFKTESEKL